MTQAEHQSEQDRPDQASFGQLNDLAQTIVSRTLKSRALVSPWVQRALTGQSSISASSSGSARPLRPALSGPGLGAMLRKVRLKSESSRVWRPDVGSLQPELVDRFAGAIVRRFPAVEGKYDPQPLQMASTGEAFMALPGDSPPAEEAETATAQSEQQWPSLGDLQRAIEAKSSWPHSPGQPSQAQPTRAEPPRPGPPPRPAGPRPQLFSRVEEISPSGRKSTRVRSTGTPPEPAAADEPAGAASPEKGAPPGPVQQSPEDEVKSPPIADRSTGEEPSFDRPEARPIQRQVTEEPPEQPPGRGTERPREESTPSKRDEPPEIEPFDRADQEEHGPASGPPLGPAVQRQSEPAQPEPDQAAPEEPDQSGPDASGSPLERLQREPEPDLPLKPSRPPLKRQAKGVQPDRESDSEQVRSADEPASRPAQSEPDQPESPKSTQRESDVSRSQIDRQIADTQEEHRAAPGPPTEPTKSSIQRRPDDRPEPVKPERSLPEVAAPSSQESEEGLVEDRSVSGSESKPAEGPAQPPIQRQEPESRAAAPPRSESIGSEVDETDQRVDHDRAIQPEPPPDMPERPRSAIDPETLTDRMERQPESKAPAQASLPPVQRQTQEERPPPSRPRQTERRAVEASPPESPEPEPATPGAAAPQEEVGAEDVSGTISEAYPTKTEGSLPLVQRRPEPATKSTVKSDSGLEQQLLARAASRVKLPLIEPLQAERPLSRIKPVLQTQPAQTSVPARFTGGDVERRTVEPLAPGRSRVQESPTLPARRPVVARREPATVQPDSTGRSPVAVELPLPRLASPVAPAGASPAGPEMILRAEEPGAVTEETEATDEEQAEPELDLDQLAKQVYPHIRRLLQVERERRVGLSTLNNL